MKTVIFEADIQIQSYIKNSLVDSSCEIIFVDQPLSIENVFSYKDAEVISVFIYSEVSKEIINNLPLLKFIATRSTGFDHVDCVYAKKKGIAISYVPDYARNAVAEFTFGLMFNIVRNINFAANQLPAFGYEKSLLLYGTELRNKTLGVIGAGNIGRRVIEIAQIFGINVVVYDIFEDQDFAKKYDCIYASLNDVLASADILTLHVPCTKETYHLINKKTISCMKKGAYIINTARGALINVKDLTQSLLSGYLAGAACDVLEYEHFMNDPLLLIKQKVPGEALQIILFNRMLMSLPNAIITPHIAYCSDEALKNMLEITLKNIQGFLAGNPKNLA